MTTLPMCPYCERRRVAVGQNKKANRTCGVKECVRQATSQSAAKLSIFSTTMIDEGPRDFAPTGKTKTRTIAGQRVKLRQYRNPNDVLVWTSAPPVPPSRRVR